MLSIGQLHSLNFFSPIMMQCAASLLVGIPRFIFFPKITIQMRAFEQSSHLVLFMRLHKMAAIHDLITFAMN